MFDGDVQVNLDFEGNSEGLLTLTVRPKLLILGHAQHGKDTVAEILRDEHGFNLESSSHMMAKRLMSRELLYMNYETWQDCFEDRHNHRELWFHAFKDFNKDDKTAWAREVLKHSDIYVGMRNREEFNACKEAGLFDDVLFVNRRNTEFESPMTMQLTESDANYVIDNCRDLDSLRFEVDYYADILLGRTGSTL